MYEKSQVLFTENEHASFSNTENYKYADENITIPYLYGLTMKLYLVFEIDTSYASHIEAFILWLNYMVHLHGILTNVGYLMRHSIIYDMNKKFEVNIFNMPEHICLHTVKCFKVQ